MLIDKIAQSRGVMMTVFFKWFTVRTVLQLLPYCHPHYDTFRSTPAPIERYLASRYQDAMQRCF